MCELCHVAFCATYGNCASMLRRVSGSQNDVEEVSARGTPAVQRMDIPTVIITLVAVVVYVLHAWAYRTLFLGNAVDDAYISFRYLENLATGHGLVYNPGEHVEGFSNPLWIFLLLPFRLAGADVVRTSQVLGIGFGAATIVLAVIAVR